MNTMTASTHENGAASETTPLIATSADEPILSVNDEEILDHEHHHGGKHSDSNGSRAPQPEKPLDKVQIFLLCYARLVEPVAYFSIFPYISEMIFGMGDMTEADVGFYAGVIVRPFPLHRMQVVTKKNRNRCSH